MNFIDLFAGCGGLSLGLMTAGLSGVFAIEKSVDAFTTLIHNLNNDNLVHGYNWPDWLPKQEMTTGDLLCRRSNELKKLRGKIDVIAGGPPCQGFSFAGLRNPKDPRNLLTSEYIKVVSLIKPKFLFLENVKGFKTAFKHEGPIDHRPYSEYVIDCLTRFRPGYKIFSSVVYASDFSVPQHRPRFVMFGIRVDVAKRLGLISLSNEEFFRRLEICSEDFRKKHDLPTKVTVKDAIDDLKTARTRLIQCEDSVGFKQIKYQVPKKCNSYLKLMRRNASGSPNSLRLANHKKETVQKFRFLLKYASKGHSISQELREKIHTKKQCFTVLDPDSVSTTITTLPDDCMHYSEPRILTVRECARLQSFPDWFDFKGKYTTGGHRRKLECPRYTQVGNAVPPLMAEIIGRFLLQLNAKYEENDEKRA